MKNPQWSWLPISDLFNISAGKTMSAATRSGAFQVPFLRTSNVFWDEIDLSQLDQMSIEPKELEKKKLAIGDLLVCEGGEIGRSAIWDGQVDIISFQNHLHRLRPAQNDVVPRFYVYFLQSAFTQLGMFEGAGNKTTIPNLSRNRLAALEVPKPSFEEQQGIAAALSSVRTAIKINEQLLLTAQELKRAAMREVFTRGLRGEAQKQTEIGLVPESWTYCPIGEIFNIVQGLSLKGNLSDNKEGYVFLRTSNVYWGRIKMAKISRMNVSDRTIGDRTLRKGDLLVCEGGDIGRAAVWDAEIDHCTFQNHLHRLRPIKQETIHPRFAMAWLEEGFVHRQVYEGAGNKTTIPNLSRSRLAELKMPLPSWEEQTQIVTILSAIDDKIALHKRKKAALEALFTSLLHQLMTGKIRVDDLDLSSLNVPQTEAA